MENISAEAAEKIGKKIANCDFQVRMSKYLTGPAHPWVLTVGELKWQRHLVITRVCTDGDAELALLADSRDDLATMPYMYISNIESVVRLNDLIAGRYLSVKKVLQSATKAA